MRGLAIISVELTKVSDKKQAPNWRSGGYIIYRKGGPLNSSLVTNHFYKTGRPLGNKSKILTPLKKFFH